jgi:tetratricopeptide (TPR) repeat protein
MSIADFVKATELDPNDDIAWNNRCYVEAVLGRLSDALADCNKAIELGNHYNMSFDSRAYVYLQSKRYDDAIADYTTALKWDPKSPDATYGRAVAKKYKGDSSSEEDFKVAKRLDPNIESEFLSHSAED